MLPLAVIAGLDPAIQSFSGHWIAGSSPAMTIEVAGTNDSTFNLTHSGECGFLSGG
jgi:hypothetical protein